MIAYAPECRSCKTVVAELQPSIEIATLTFFLRVMVSMMEDYSALKFLSLPSTNDQPKRIPAIYRCPSGSIRIAIVIINRQHIPPNCRRLDGLSDKLRKRQNIWS